MLANTIEVLKTFDWGTDLAAVGPIDEAVIASYGNENARQDLENRLVVALQWDISRDAKDYVCRKLAIVGTAACVPVLSELVKNKDHSHMARFALERITAPEAAQALRDALGHVDGNVKVGVINSLGARRDPAAVAPLIDVVRDNDPAVARAAALALGAIGTVEAATILQAALADGAGNQPAVLDALLTCADALLAGDDKSGAVEIFKSLSDGKHGRLVRLAATRGMLACAGKAS